MNDLVQRAAGPAGLLGGGLWLTIPVVANNAPSVLPALYLAPVLIAVALGGVHLRYRKEKKAFYEEIGLALSLLGLFATIVAMSLYSPANTSQFMGLLLSMLPVVVAAALLIAGSALVSIAVSLTDAFPRYGPVLLGLALPVDVLVYLAQMEMVGMGVSVYGLVWCLLGYLLHTTPDA